MCIYILRARTYARTTKHILTFFERKKHSRTPRLHGFILRCTPSMTLALYSACEFVRLYRITSIFTSCNLTISKVIIYIFYRYIHVRLEFYYTYFEITFLTYRFRQIRQHNKFPIFRRVSTMGCGGGLPIGGGLEIPLQDKTVVNFQLFILSCTLLSTVLTCFWSVPRRH